MVGRQAVGPDLDASLAHLFGEDVAVAVLVAVFEEDRLAPIAPRGDMMRKAGGHDARQASHGGRLCDGEQNGSF